MSCALCGSSGPLVGSNPTIEFDFTADDGITPADPDDLSIKVLFPDGTIESYADGNATVTNPTVGHWEFKRATAYDQPGEYWVYAVGSGLGVDIARERSFHLDDTHVPLP